MEANNILMYIQSHGYIVLFLSLFFGIVGIPAPEESLFVFRRHIYFTRSIAFI
ncbi:hypothetical protein LR68_04018 [Anoxybacillus sp. BCO1]|nr:hypothetical protein LR68_04018 [Anoxybacillus sp. BCO1]